VDARDDRLSLRPTILAAYYLRPALIPSPTRRSSVRRAKKEEFVAEYPPRPSIPASVQSPLQQLRSADRDRHAVRDLALPLKGAPEAIIGAALVLNLVNSLATTVTPTTENWQKG
jgi:hypothetical protein